MRGRKGFSGGVMPVPNIGGPMNMKDGGPVEVKGYEDGGITPYGLKDGGKPQDFMIGSSKELSAKIAAIIVQGKLNGHVTREMTAELAYLGEQLSKQKAIESRRGRRSR